MDQLSREEETENHCDQQGEADPDQRRSCNGLDGLISFLHRDLNNNTPIHFFDGLKDEQELLPTGRLKLQVPFLSAHDLIHHGEMSHIDLHEHPVGIWVGDQRPLMIHDISESSLPYPDFCHHIPNRFQMDLGYQNASHFPWISLHRHCNDNGWYHLMNDPKVSVINSTFRAHPKHFCSGSVFSLWGTLLSE